MPGITDEEKEEKEYREKVHNAVYCEIGDCLDCDDEAIIDDWIGEIGAMFL